MPALCSLLPTPKLTGRNLYHYTTQEGLLGILSSRTLWTTSIHYLNDSTEFNFAVGLIRQELESRARASRTKSRTALYERTLGNLGALKAVTTYVGSFSEEGDSLSQWRAYTQNGIGFSLGFKDNDLASLATKQSYRLAKCLYDEKGQSKTIAKLIEWLESANKDIAQSLFWGGLIEVAPLLKHPAFRDEKEWRIIGAMSGFSSAFRSDESPEFRPGRSMLIPYRRFKLEDDHGYLRVREAYMGPTPHVELAHASLAMVGNTKKMGEHVTVQPSKVPYRSW